MTLCVDEGTAVSAYVAGVGSQALVVQSLYPADRSHAPLNLEIAGSSVANPNVVIVSIADLLC